MRGWGTALAIAGLIVAIGALFLPTTADAAVYNLGLLQEQMLVFVGGCSMSVSGVAIAVAGAVIEASKRGMPLVGNPQSSEMQAVRPAFTVVPHDEDSLDRAARLERGQQSDRLVYIIGGVIVVLALVVWLALGSR